MNNTDKVLFQGNKIITLELVRQLRLLASSRRLRHGVNHITSVYTVFTNPPYNTRIEVMVEMTTPDGFSIMELKSVDVLGEFLSDIEIV